MNRLAPGAIPTGPLDHVAVAVHDLDVACERYARLFGARVSGRERVESGGVEVAFVELPGQTRIELVAPLHEESPITRFLQRRGQALHHICCLVEDVDEAIQQAQLAGVPVIDTVARAGADGSRIAFLNPDALGGVLLELKQKG